MKKSVEQQNSVDYYLRLQYPVSIRALTQEEGGGFLATIPQLGSSTFLADGETMVEALEALEELRQLLIPQLVESGVSLPEPEISNADIEAYSGSLMLRVSKKLHAQLAAAAKRNSVSLNKFAAELLAQGLGNSSAMEQMSAMLSAYMEPRRQTVPVSVFRDPPSSPTAGHWNVPREAAVDDKVDEYALSSLGWEPAR